MKKLHLLPILILASILASNAQPEGTINGLFSVADDQQVRFSKGNLQYQASTNTWRFAENQYDALTTENTKVSATYDGWIDLFGWGTSGYNEKHPYMTSYDPLEYGNGENEIENTLYDWGLHNAISNGGNKAGLWRTPTLNEWYYIIVRRTNADSLHGLACVNGINGLIILPDNWTTPEDLIFNPGGVSEDSYGTEDFKTINEYSLEQWRKMEELGALFLPTTGFRFIYEDGGMDIYSSQTHGYYWSATSNKDEEAFMLNFGAASIAADATYTRKGGFAVRLITDYNPQTTNLNSNSASTINIYTSNNTLHIENYSDKYQIYNLCGTLIYSGNAPSITLKQGIYIIKTNSTIQKIIL